MEYQCQRAQQMDQFQSKLLQLIAFFNKDLNKITKQIDILDNERICVEKIANLYKHKQDALLQYYIKNKPGIVYQLKQCYIEEISNTQEQLNNFQLIFQNQVQRSQEMQLIPRQPIEYLDQANLQNQILSPKQPIIQKTENHVPYHRKLNQEQQSTNQQMIQQRQQNQVQQFPQRQENQIQSASKQYNQYMQDMRTNFPQRENPQQQEIKLQAVQQQMPQSPPVQQSNKQQEFIVKQISNNRALQQLQQDQQSNQLQNLYIKKRILIYDQPQATQQSQNQSIDINQNQNYNQQQNIQNRRPNHRLVLNNQGLQQFDSIQLPSIQKQNLRYQKSGQSPITQNRNVYISQKFDQQRNILAPLNPIFQFDSIQPKNYINKIQKNTHQEGYQNQINNNQQNNFQLNQPGIFQNNINNISPNQAPQIIQNSSNKYSPYNVYNPRYRQYKDKQYPNTNQPYQQNQWFQNNTAREQNQDIPDQEILNQLRYQGALTPRTNVSQQNPLKNHNNQQFYQPEQRIKSARVNQNSEFLQIQQQRDIQDSNQNSSPKRNFNETQNQKIQLDKQKFMTTEKNQNEENSSYNQSQSNNQQNNEKANLNLDQKQLVQVQNQQNQVENQQKMVLEEQISQDNSIIESYQYRQKQGEFSIVDYKIQSKNAANFINKYLQDKNQIGMNSFYSKFQVEVLNQKNLQSYIQEMKEIIKDNLFQNKNSISIQDIDEFYQNYIDNNELETKLKERQNQNIKKQAFPNTNKE